jgi:hypothetical protein
MLPNPKPPPKPPPPNPKNPTSAGDQWCRTPIIPGYQPHPKPVRQNQRP